MHKINLNQKLENKTEEQEISFKDLVSFRKQDEELLPVLATIYIPAAKYLSLFGLGYAFAEKDVREIIGAGLCFLFSLGLDRLYDSKKIKWKDIK